MKIYVGLLLTVLTLMYSSAARQKNGQEAFSSCAAVGQALKDSQQLRAGIARRDVEKYFERDGGAQFPSSTRYVYVKCRYLHVDVEFDPKGSPGKLFSDDDLVVGTSKLYVDYSAKD